MICCRWKALRSARRLRGSRTGSGTICCSLYSMPERWRPASSRRTDSRRRRWRSAVDHLVGTGDVRALIVNAGNANAGTGAAGVAACRADVRGRRIDARLRIVAGPSVFNRCHHGAAAGRQDRRRAAGRAPRARARPLVRRSLGDHDHGHGAERASRRIHSMAPRHGDRNRQGRRDDPSRHGDDALLRRDRRARSPRCCASSPARSPTSPSTARPSTGTRRPTTAS